MENKLTFKGREYILIEVAHPRFIVYDMKERYKDIGSNVNQQEDPTRFECLSIRILDKFYALKLTEDGK